ncbi:MAG: hypothetical protein HQ564_01280 [Candidatus Saganbacteria bacterium]|nr:hypothetical protein [Candidatus Saganbacteria bacterium]
MAIGATRVRARLETILTPKLNDFKRPLISNPHYEMPRGTNGHSYRSEIAIEINPETALDNSTRLYLQATNFFQLNLLRRLPGVKTILGSRREREGWEPKRFRRTIGSIASLFGVAAGGLASAIFVSLGWPALVVGGAVGGGIAYKSGEDLGQLADWLIPSEKSLDNYANIVELELSSLESFLFDPQHTLPLTPLDFILCVLKYDPQALCKFTVENDGLPQTQPIKELINRATLEMVRSKTRGRTPIYTQEAVDALEEIIERREAETEASRRNLENGGH